MRRFSFNLFEFDINHENDNYWFIEIFCININYNHWTLFGLERDGWLCILNFTHQF